MSGEASSQACLPRCCVLHAWMRKLSWRRRRRHDLSAWQTSYSIGDRWSRGTHLRRQLSFDLWYVFLGLFIITIAEGDRLQRTDQYNFQIFSVLFEVVSAYGTVGLSLGYPGVNASFTSQFRTISKLVICAMQLRGRHRGLPYTLDRAILLPSEHLHDNEITDAERRTRRRTSSFSQMPTADQQDNGTTSGLDPKSNADFILRRQSTRRSQRSQR